jgi:putative transposase
VSIHLVAGRGVLTRAAAGGGHLPSARVRRYPSDTSDAEWRLINRHVPAASGSGRPPCYSRRDIVDAIRYLAHNGCVWRAPPVDFPPWRTVYHYFRAWIRDGTVTRLHAALRDLTRRRAGRQVDSTAAIADSQSVRTAETAARPNRGYDAGKKVNGRKRDIVVDTCGLLLVVLVTAANVQDRDAGRNSLLEQAHHDGPLASGCTSAASRQARPATARRRPPSGARRARIPRFARFRLPRRDRRRYRL